MATMPQQKPGKSRQDYSTPPEFLDAVRQRLGIATFIWDLAATAENSVSGVHTFFGEGQNALEQDWRWSTASGWCWLNPPYARIEPWVDKASASAMRYGTQIAMLVPASVGSNWWHWYVDGEAHVIFVNPRLTFVGEKTPYPKDLALLLYTPLVKGGYETWRWKP